MQKLSFHYHLDIAFDSPIFNHHFTLRCFPKSDERQQISNLQTFLFPRQFLTDSSDAFGNICVIGRENSPHQKFEADVCGDAVTGLAESVLEENAQKENIFRYQTLLTKPEKELFEFAQSLPTKNNSIEMAERIVEELYKIFTYKTGSTNVSTRAEDAFSQKQGVCQDYSHIMISVLREKGFLARYVVGMLMGEGLSHAWVEVKHNDRWYGFDPTNNKKVSDCHIKISHGRDYQDCMINKGQFFGNANQKQNISVIVQMKE